MPSSPRGAPTTRLANVQLIFNRNALAEAFRIQLVENDIAVICNACGVTVGKQLRDAQAHLCACAQDVGRSVAPTVVPPMETPHDAAAGLRGPPKTLDALANTSGCHHGGSGAGTGCVGSNPLQVLLENQTLRGRDLEGVVSAVQFVAYHLALAEGIAFTDGRQGNDGLAWDARPLMEKLAGIVGHDPAREYSGYRDLVCAQCNSYCGMFAYVDGNLPEEMDVSSVYCLFCYCRLQQERNASAKGRVLQPLVDALAIHRFCSVLAVHGVPRDKDYVKESSSLEVNLVPNIVLSSVSGNGQKLGLDFDEFAAEMKLLDAKQSHGTDDHQGATRSSPESATSVEGVGMLQLGDLAIRAGSRSAIAQVVYHRRVVEDCRASAGIFDLSSSCLLIESRHGVGGTGWHVDRGGARNIAFGLQPVSVPRSNTRKRKLPLKQGAVVKDVDYDQPLARWDFLHPRQLPELHAFLKEQFGEQHLGLAAHPLPLLTYEQVGLLRARVGAANCFSLYQYAAHQVDVPPGLWHQVTNLQGNFKVAWDYVNAPSLTAILQAHKQLGDFVGQTAVDDFVRAMDILLNYLEYLPPSYARAGHDCN